MLRKMKVMLLSRWTIVFFTIMVQIIDKPRNKCKNMALVKRMWNEDRSINKDMI